MSPKLRNASAESFKEVKTCFILTPLYKEAGCWCVPGQRREQAPVQPLSTFWLCKSANKYSCYHKTNSLTDKSKEKRKDALIGEEKLWTFYLGHANGQRKSSSNMKNNK